MNHAESIGRCGVELERPWTCMRSWPNTKHLVFTCVASKLKFM
jgi:hypothetical protein